MIGYLRPFYLLCVIAAFGALGARASEVLRVNSTTELLTITHNPDREWTNGEFVCVVRASEELACGYIVEVTRENAQVKLDYRRANIEEGDQVRPSAPTDAETTGDSLVTDEDTEDGEKEESEEYEEDSLNNTENAIRGADGIPDANQEELHRVALVRYHRKMISVRPRSLNNDDIESLSQKLPINYNVSLGTVVNGLAGGNSVWPYLHLQSALSSTNSIGLLSEIYGFNYGGALVRNVNFMLTFAYYPVSTFDGIHLQGGVGIGFARYQVVAPVGATDSVGNRIALNAHLAVGWRFLRTAGFNAALSFGGQFTRVPNIQNFTTSSSTLAGDLMVAVPTLRLEIGFAF